MSCKARAGRACQPVAAHIKENQERPHYTPLRSETKHLPAAVLQEDDPRAANVARVVLKRAKLVKVGGAVVGYWLRPAVAKYRFSFRARRVREADDLARLRYQDFPPPPAAARAFAVAIAHHSEPNAAAAWIKKWCVTLTPDERADILADAAANPRKFRAAELGELLGLRRGERRLLGIRTMRAVGQTKRELTLANKRRKLDRQRAARAAQPAKPMSIEKAKPWLTEGVSRATWFRARAKANVEKRETDPETHIVDIYLAHFQSQSCARNVAATVTSPSPDHGPVTVTAARLERDRRHAGRTMKAGGGLGSSPAPPDVRARCPRPLRIFPNLQFPVSASATGAWRTT